MKNLYGGKQEKEMSFRTDPPYVTTKITNL